MRVILPLVLLGFLVAGCADHSDGNEAPDSELYVKFTQARDSVMIGDPWTEATRRIEERLGPARAKSDTEWRWSTVQGDECFDLRVMRKGLLDNVERITNTYVMATVADEFARCKAMVESNSAQ